MTVVCAAGLVTTRQRPETANAITFALLDDETGIVNVVVRPELYEQLYRGAVARGAGGAVPKRAPHQPQRPGSVDATQPIAGYLVRGGAASASGGAVVR